LATIQQLGQSVLGDYAMDAILRDVRKKVVTLTPSGRLDSFAAPRLKAKLIALIEAGHNQIVLDLRYIEFIDSAGIEVLVTTLNKTRNAGGDTILMNAYAKRIIKVLQIIQLDKIFTIAETIEQAMERFEPVS
jgi:anti-sigma B factor antagonist